MSSTDINFDIHRPYSVYICSGKGKNYRESGSYTAYGTSYLDAALRFASHWNHCTLFKKYGEKWKKSGRRAKMPKHHCYVKDEKGNKFLLLPR